MDLTPRSSRLVASGPARSAVGEPVPGSPPVPHWRISRSDECGENRLCGAPHKRFYVEFRVMRTKLLMGGNILQSINKSLPTCC